MTAVLDTTINDAPTIPAPASTVLTRPCAADPAACPLTGRDSCPDDQALIDTCTAC